jgi:aryl-alcohol dehydrogenase-like predicted oxidoreductase
MQQLSENVSSYFVKLNPEVLAEIEKIHLTYTNPAP